MIQSYGAISCLEVQLSLMRNGFENKVKTSTSRPNVLRYRKNIEKCSHRLEPNIQDPAQNHFRHLNPRPTRLRNIVWGKVSRFPSHIQQSRKYILRRLKDYILSLVSKGMLRLKINSTIFFVVKSKCANFAQVLLTTSTNRQDKHFPKKTLVLLEI